jgi:galactokinase
MDDFGLDIVIVETGGSHEHLTEEYAAVEREMKEVADSLSRSEEKATDRYGPSVKAESTGQKPDLSSKTQSHRLREFTQQEFLSRLPHLRQQLSERALLRAWHFFEENRRVEAAQSFLAHNDTHGFLRTIIDAGSSSWMLCQNCYSSAAASEQPIPLALKVSEHMLQGKGAWRVHGGGFAGTIQAFVPFHMVPTYTTKMESLFGKGCCTTLDICEEGVLELYI